MRDRFSDCSRETGRCFLPHSCARCCGRASTIDAASPASALPSFARQTGQPCGTCHTDFPGLTPFGRRFKLLGYTTGGGDLRTTPFSNNNGPEEASRAARDTTAGSRQGDRPQPQRPAGEQGWVPPVSMMAIVGLHPYAGSDSPRRRIPTSRTTTSCCRRSVGSGAARSPSNIGAFAQVTYNAPDPVSGLVGTPADQFKHTWSWDNTDVRFASTASIGSLDVIYGHHRQQQSDRSGSVEHDASVVVSLCGILDLGATPGASTMIEGAFAAHVVAASAPTP